GYRTKNTKTTEKAKSRRQLGCRTPKVRRHELHQKDRKARGGTLSGQRNNRPFSIVYVPGKLIVSGDAAATAANILASQRLFRLGIGSELVCATEFVFLLWVLYRLFVEVNKTHASLMVIFGLVFVPIMLLNTLNEIAAFTLLRGADFLSVFDKPHRES